MPTAPGHLLLVYALAAVATLVWLIARAGLNAFVAIVIVSLALGIAAGMPISQVVVSFEKGVGGTLGHIALVVGLGTMLGKLMAESRGAERIARTLIDAFGRARVDWAMATVAFIVGLPVFFEVGFVLLVPIVFSVARRTGTSMVRVGIPMAAGLSVVHGLVPPHPAALLAVSAYGADIGKTILAAIVIGVPAAAIGGPLLARLVDRHVVVDAPNAMADQFAEPGSDARERPMPSFVITLSTILLPVLLMLAGGWADAIAPRGTSTNEALRFVGHPVVALLLATLIGFRTFGTAQGFSRATITRFTNECLAPTAGITLVVGAGAGFGGILKDCGVSAAIVTLATHAQVSTLVLAWLVAALMRVATGSATVAMSTSAGIVAPIAAAGSTSPELLVLATGGGALVLSHVNDGGFWLVKEYFGLTVTQTFQTWTVCETLISLVTLVGALALSAVW